MKTVNRLACVALGALAALVGMTSEARAEYPKPGLYIGVFGGYTLKLGDWDLGEAPRKDKSFQPKSAPIVGLRLGYHIIPQLIAEIGGGYLPIKSTKGGNNTGFKYDFDLYFHFLKSDWSPFLGLGGGAYLTTKGGDLGGDNDIQGHASLGLRGLVHPNLAIRLEVRDYLVDAYGDWKGNNLEFTGGLDIYPFGKKKEAAPPSDRDGDGVPDVDDACPDNPGPAELKGCPDRDKDGVADHLDKCPDEPGDPAHQGCPPPPPDKDGDGVPDADDLCPDTPGKPEFQGCLDTDGDGVYDHEDRCPEEAGLKELKGCPDRDGDGVADIDDKCPDKPGLPDHDGCVPEAVAKFTGTIKGINFATGSDRILPNSYAVLNDAVKVLQDYPTLRLQIDGHTDDRGNDDMNQKLSEARAASVKAYLVSKGVDESRLATTGYGESKPIEDNKTAFGRAANRRIEFSIMK